MTFCKLLLWEYATMSTAAAERQYWDKDENQHEIIYPKLIEEYVWNDDNTQTVWLGDLPRCV